MKIFPPVRPPSIIIFDVDGVLVDVRGSFLKTTLETVRFFTGKRVTAAEWHRWKNRSGYNDDWKLSTAWVRSLGGHFEYEEVKRRFVELYWGKNRDGNVRRERWMLPRRSLQRLSKDYELDLFTGRNRQELNYTLDRTGVRSFFRRIVTVEEVKLPKPDPEGLLKILDGRNPSAAVYVGDNIDDALAARSARVRFVGILPRGGSERRQRLAGLRKAGAETILNSIKELQAFLSRPKTQNQAKTPAP